MPIDNAYHCGFYDERFSTYFGFKEEEEVIDALAYYDLLSSIADVKSWYNGYKFSSTEIYNPWSILNFLRREKLERYWVNTGQHLLLKKILVSNKYNNMKTELVKLLNGENISYNEVDGDEILAFTILLLTGYLTVSSITRKNDENYYNLKIPNKEVKKEFESIINTYLNTSLISEHFDRFRSGLLLGSTTEMEISLNNILSSSQSFHDNNEGFYHGLVLAMLIYMGDDYHVKSNRIGSKGRYDACIESRDGSFGAIFEFKKSDTPLKLEAKAQEAKEQINEKEYTADLKERNIKTIYKFGIAFTTQKAKVLLDETP